MNIIEEKKLGILSTVQNGLPEIRRGLGLTQDAFAKLLGKTRQIISLIERGESPLSWETFLAVVTVAAFREPKLLDKLYGESFKEDLRYVLNNPS